MLIDRFTGMPLHEFFSIVEDSFDRSRGPILLALIATSIRAKNPDWTPERIVRTVQNLNLSDVVFIDAEQDETPVPQRAEEAPSTGKNSAVESKSSATQAAAETSGTSKPTLV